jgi:hypothetical protein
MYRKYEMKVLEFVESGYRFTLIEDVLIVSIVLEDDVHQVYVGRWRDLESPPSWVEAFWRGLGKIRRSHTSFGLKLEGYTLADSGHSKTARRVEA